MDVYILLLHILDTKVGVTKIQCFQAWNCVENRSSESCLWRGRIKYQINDLLVFTFKWIKACSSVTPLRQSDLKKTLVPSGLLYILGHLERWQCLLKRLGEDVGKGYLPPLPRPETLLLTIGALYSSVNNLYWTSSLVYWETLEWKGRWKTACVFVGPYFPI